MVIARSRIVNPSEPGWYHCISRCVRRAYLCGDDALGRNCDHRKAWVRDRLRLLSQLYAVEVAGYAVMSNHFHVVLRVDPTLPESWDAEEVVRRWLTIFPSRYSIDGTAVPPQESVVQQRAQNVELVTKLRLRLGSLSWFMRSFKEPIARRANKEDDCGGAFWEGRFNSIALLDEAAVLACMAYVDLNPIRAGIAATPEESDYTSVQERALALDSRRPQSLLAKADAVKSQWLLPIASCVSGVDEAWYLHMVDHTGRFLRGENKGTIPNSLLPILQRLEIDQTRWVEAMARSGESRGTAMGHAAVRMREAVRRGMQWISSYSRIFNGQKLRSEV